MNTKTKKPYSLLLPAIAIFCMMVTTHQVSAQISPIYILNKSNLSISGWARTTSSSICTGTCKDLNGKKHGTCCGSTPEIKPGSWDVSTWVNQPAGALIFNKYAPGKSFTIFVNDRKLVKWKSNRAYKPTETIKFPNDFTAEDKNEQGFDKLLPKIKRPLPPQPSALDEQKPVFESGAIGTFNNGLNTLYSIQGEIIGANKKSYLRDLLPNQGYFKETMDEKNQITITPTDSNFQPITLTFDANKQTINIETSTTVGSDIITSKLQINLIALLNQIIEDPEKQILIDWNLNLTSDPLLKVESIGYRLQKLVDTKAKAYDPTFADTLIKTWQQQLNKPFVGGIAQKALDTWEEELTSEYVIKGIFTDSLPKTVTEPFPNKISENYLIDKEIVTKWQEKKSA